MNANIGIRFGEVVRDNNNPRIRCSTVLRDGQREPIRCYGVPMLSGRPHWTPESRKVFYGKICKVVNER